jgi:hypothetical protein
MPVKSKTASGSLLYTVLRVFRYPDLRVSAARTLKSIMYNFFFLQYKAALLPGRIPVTPVDHPLDEYIPFTPKWVAVYLDFVAYWVRMIGFLFTQYGRRAVEPVKDFVESMGKLYAFAAEVYAENLSTTSRPRYYSRPRFLLIHIFDPHLMCVPSLHVMVVIRTYTKFRAIIRSLGEEARFAAQINETRRSALAITEAILYVKQHSVNCVSAAMYAMSCFEHALFPEEEAGGFAADLFTGPGSPEESKAIRAYIIEKYRQFREEGKRGKDWRGPLLRFLKNPAKKITISNNI